VRAWLAVLFVVALASSLLASAACSDDVPLPARPDAAFPPDQSSPSSLPFCPGTRETATGAACTYPAGSTCVTTVVIDHCSGNWRLQQCHCDAGVWSCETAPSCPPLAYDSGCPDPATVTADAACTASSSLDCTGPLFLCGTNIITVDDYSCIGGAWQQTAGSVCSDAGFD
jgi:hypothetical protein